MKLRLATSSDIPATWSILQQAIERRRLDGSQQWQNGYPNVQSIENDLANGNAYVLADGETIAAYAAIIFDIEPAYTAIQGKWLTNGDYCVVHRVATSDAVKGKGIGALIFQEIEKLCLQKKVYSIKVDTNFDNVAMLKIVDRLGYTYCGEVFFHGSARRAYEKVLR